MILSNSNGFNGIKRAVFLDRDGTINIEKDYLYKIEDFEFIPGAPEAILRLNRAGFLVVIITNQSGVARGYYSEDELVKLHRHISDELSAIGAIVDGWYFCPHHLSGRPPYNIDCGCRKPLPGMLLQAARDLDINLENSWMVGDKLADVEAGIAAGCRPVLVKTGYGAEMESGLPLSVAVAADISSAADMIIAV